MSRTARPGVGQRLARAAGGDQLDAEAGQAAGQVDQAGLVADAEQGTANGTQGHRSVPPRVERAEGILWIRPVDSENGRRTRPAIPGNARVPSPNTRSASRSHS